MTSVAASDEFVRLTLVAPCAATAMAAPTVARHLQVSLSEAFSRLSEVPSTLADQIDSKKARHLASLLLALGAKVRLDKVTADKTLHLRTQPKSDLSIQPLNKHSVPKLAKELVTHLPPFLMCSQMQANAIELLLSGSDGMVIEGLTQIEIEKTKRTLRKIPGLRVIVSNSDNALYDLLPDHRIDYIPTSDFIRTLRSLGLAPCKLTGALASHIDRVTRNHILAHYPEAGLIASNHQFQRFDLFLTGAHNVSPRELADFLIVRSDLPRETLERMRYPLKIESGLSRANALAFQADYSALGFETCARLRIFQAFPAR